MPVEQDVSISKEPLDGNSRMATVLRGLAGVPTFEFYTTGISGLPNKWITGNLCSKYMLLRHV